MSIKLSDIIEEWLNTNNIKMHRSTVRDYNNICRIAFVPDDKDWKDVTRLIVHDDRNIVIGHYDSVDKPIIDISDIIIPDDVRIETGSLCVIVGLNPNNPWFFEKLNKWISSCSSMAEQGSLKA